MHANERAIRALLRSPWAIQEAKLEEILGFIEAHGAGERLSEEEARNQFGAARSSDLRAVGQIAVIPIYGTIIPRANMMSAWSGGTSCQALAKNFDEALNNDDVSAIVLDIDSPGGSVSGVEEVARKIERGRGKKPVHAVSNYLMASAAYYIGSQADEVAVSPSGEAGSIGVYMLHTDVSEAAAKAGIRHTIIKAGRYKAEGHPYAPLGEEAEAALQAEVDEFYDLFVAAVARGRKVKEAAVRNGFGEGRCLSAKRAVQEGIADKVATLDEVLDGLRGHRPAGRGRAMVFSAGTPTRGALEASMPAPVPGDIAGLTALLETHTGDAASTAGLVITGGDVRVRHGAPYLHPSGQALNADDEVKACPECGADMQRDEGTWTCPGCGYTDSESEQDDTNGQDAGGAAPEAATATPEEQAPEAREETMSTTTDTAPQTAGAQHNVDAILQAERERARQIRGMAAEHGIDAAKATEWIDAGHSVATVQGLVLQEIRTTAANQPKITVGADRETQKPFRSMGEQLLAIRAADTGRGVDKRLYGVLESAGLQAASGSSAGVPSDGGWLVQQDFTDGIVTKMWDEGDVLSRVNKTPIGEGKNGLIRNVLDEKSRADGGRYGGVRVYRVAEAATVEASRPKLRRQQILLEKLMGIYYATEEILEDASALAVEAERGFRSELLFVSENEVFRGSGSGQALGFLSSPAKVTVAKEGSQTGGTIVVANVAKMLARLPARSYRTAVWYYNPACLPQLVTMTIGQQPVFVPAGNVAGAPFGTLFGLPIMPSEYCEALGTEGDIVLADLAQYTAIDKGEGNWQSSIHVRFLYDETAFKLTYRFNGQPDWEESVTPFKGSDKISPFITLATRS